MIAFGNNRPLSKAGHPASNPTTTSRTEIGAQEASKPDMRSKDQQNLLDLVAREGLNHCTAPADRKRTKIRR